MAGTPSRRSAKRHKKDLGSRAPGPLFLQPPHTPSSWKNNPTREQIRRFRRVQKKDQYPYIGPSGTESADWNDGSKRPPSQWVWDERRPFRTYSERRGWDSNPRGCYPYTISSRARSTGLCHLSTRPQASPQFKGRRTGHLLHASEANGAGVRKA